MLVCGRLAVHKAQSLDTGHTPGFVLVTLALQRAHADTTQSFQPRTA